MIKKYKLNIFLIVLIPLLLCETASALEVEILNVTGNVGETVNIQISVSDAEDLGAMNIVVAYDQQILRPTKIEKGDIVNGLFSSDVSQAGLVSIGLTDPNGINGDGVIATMSFEVLKKGSTPLKILHLKAYNAKTHVDIKAKLKSGYFETKEGEKVVTEATSEKKSPGFEIILGIIAITTIVTLKRKTS